METITPSSGNVFADLGLPDAEELLVKSNLACGIMRVIRDRKLTQKKAASIMGISQPRLSGLLRGKFEGISEAKMMECLTALGEDIQITIRKHKATRNHAPGKIQFVFA